ncbi:hypothetical protein PO909_033682 [Leuciscus waleckii]
MHLSLLLWPSHSFYHLAATAPFDDETLKSIFWIGAYYYHPVDLPDTTGLGWREAIIRCLESVYPRSRLQPESRPAETTLPELLHVMPAQPETVHVMPALPVSLDKMAAAPESALEDAALIVVATALLCVWAAHTSATLPEPSAKMAAASPPEPSAKMAAASPPEPSTKMAAASPPEPSAKMAAATLPESSAMMAADATPPEPLAQSDQVYELIRTSAPVGDLVELNEEVGGHPRPLKSEFSLPQSGVIDYLMSSCAQFLPLVLSGIHVSPFPLVLPSPKSSSPPVPPSFKSSLPLVLPSTKFPSSMMVSPSLSLPLLPSKLSSLLVSAPLVLSGPSAPSPTQPSYAANASGLHCPQLCLGVMVPWLCLGSEYALQSFYFKFLL